MDGLGPELPVETTGLPGKAKPTIFIVSAVPIHPDHKEKALMWSRSWGWFPTRAEAQAAATSLDTEAGYYNYAVIEEFEPGVCTLNVGLFEWPDDGQEWYKHDESLNKFVRCERPEEYKQVCNIGLG